MSEAAPGQVGGEGPERASDATRRTYLALERTQLAWWRTGLATLAVALAVAKVVPELSGASTTWPWTVVGLGFAAYALTLLVYGTKRSNEVSELLPKGGYVAPSRTANLLLTAAGVVLLVATAALLIFD